MTHAVVLRPGREKPVLSRHPWVFAGAIRQVPDGAADGDIVPVEDADGRFLAWGFLNRRSQIAVRLLSWRPEERFDAGFWRGRLLQAWRGRESEGSGPRPLGSSPAGEECPTNAYRLVNAESDGLPGLVVDRYADWLVMQFLTLGMEVRKGELVGIVGELVPESAGIYERSDMAVRRKEGLSLVAGPLRGAPPPAEVIVRENGLNFAVDLAAGHKTGFYLDQRENRARLERHAAGREVLNCFAYTGAFSVYAARGGAGPIVNVESSAEALATAQRNLALNGFADRDDQYVAADVFQQLRHYRDGGRQFDLIVLDPPKFAHSKRDLERAARGYKDINWLAMRLLRPGGILFTFSCSGNVSEDLFQKILFGAALDAGRDVQIVGRLAQSADHPVLLTFPESAYLKGAICLVW
jgi:23S rRNA (cytosine1962-C5)-methyltransferase